MSLNAAIDGVKVRRVALYTSHDPSLIIRLANYSSGAASSTAQANSTNVCVGFPNNGVGTKDVTLPKTPPHMRPDFASSARL